MIRHRVPLLFCLVLLNHSVQNSINMSLPWEKCAVGFLAGNTMMCVTCQLLVEEGFPTDAVTEHTEEGYAK